MFKMDCLYPIVNNQQSLIVYMWLFASPLHAMYAYYKLYNMPSV